MASFKGKIEMKTLFAASPALSLLVLFFSTAIAAFLHNRRGVEAWAKDFDPGSVFAPTKRRFGLYALCGLIAVICSLYVVWYELVIKGPCVDFNTISNECLQYAPQKPIVTLLLLFAAGIGIGLGYYLERSDFFEKKNKSIV